MDQILKHLLTLQPKRISDEQLAKLKACHTRKTGTGWNLPA